MNLAMTAGALLLILIGVSALMVVRTRDVTSQTFSLAFYGILLALMFFYFRAPDVALSQIVVGAVALPLMFMLSIARMKKRASMAAKKSGRPRGDASR